MSASLNDSWEALNAVFAKAAARARRVPGAERVKAHHVAAGAKLILAIALVTAGSFAVRGALSHEAARQKTEHLDVATLLADADPAILHIASYHLPGAAPRPWSVRPAGWKRLDVDTPPTLGLGALSMAEARKINGLMTVSDVDIPSADPFVLNGPERTAAVHCMTTAIYYEAALEPREGQEAVAQVILNRMRHADYPKSVCGVVFQGSDRPGCQFSFACDGSMARAPAAWAWKNAKEVAEQALSGFVQKAVGTSTHYHTSWIVARWTPTVVKVAQIGQHIFFRPPGPEGMPQAFRAAYQGGESRASKTYLIGKAVVPVIAAPDLWATSLDGSVAVPRSVTKDGRLIMMGPSTTFGRVRGVIGEEGGLQTVRMPPMHQMIAMRAAAARAVKAAEREQAALAAARAAEEGSQAPASTAAPAAKAAPAAAPSTPSVEAG